MQSLDLGQATIQPKAPVTAGSYTSITFTYTTGHPIDDSGYIKIVFRSVSDFGPPQFDDPKDPNFCSITTTGDCQIEPRWDPKGHTRPWGRALFLKVRRGYLALGDKVVVVFGDTSGGSQGWQMQTFCVNTFEFKTLVDPIATYQFKELPSSPSMRIAPGEPVKAVCVAPSQVKAGEAFPYKLKLEDRWGNPTDLPVSLVHPGLDSAGVCTVSAQDPGTNLIAESNPIDVKIEKPDLVPFWADFHGQTEETVGSNTIEDYFVFARDFGMLDIAGHQGNDFQITDEFWGKINRITKTFYKPGSFVTFPGFEWSGNTPLGGDRNVFFSAEGGQITRSCTDLLPHNESQFEDSRTAADLFDKLRVQVDPSPFVFAHVGGRYSDLRMHDPEIELAVEVHSAWGTFEWLVEDALQRGYRIGICANSDGHKCRPGASYPGASKFGSLGGLTCVLAPRLDRISVFEAIKARHFYATTGNRPLVDITLTTSDNRRAILGDVIEDGPESSSMTGRVVGTGPVESVEIRNGLKWAKTLRTYARDDLGSRIKIIWSGAEVRGRDRKTSWDGGLQVEGNSILNVAPVNFWNPNQPIQLYGDNQLSWESMTTGGLSGVILTLKEPNKGRIDLETQQIQAGFEIESIGLEPLSWECGGLRKEIKIYRLPDLGCPTEFSFSQPITDLNPGDNPIYIRLMQEDGHMAWTSPIYLHKS